MNLLSEGEQFIGKQPADVEQGRSLAARLRSKAIDLSYSRATEFSPEIQELHLMAAKVALVTFGRWSSEVDQYEKDVFYYKAFNPPHKIVKEYEQFKSSR
ncbi:MAG: hypothetical protein E6R07_15035 [Nevskiaceae bacterium]|nr:MAG: hypothetical protein E6R07_15035 [Nevskiaceae bacterium]